MRNFWFVVLLCMAASCAKKNEKEAVLHVKVDNMTYDKVTLVFNATVKQVALDAGGQASITTEVPGYAYARLYYGEASKMIYLEKGDEVNISFDAGKFSDGIQFEGKNAPVVDFLNTVNYSVQGMDNYGIPFDEYVKVMETRAGEATDLLKARKLESVNPQFVEQEKERIRYIFATSLFMYPVGYPYMTQDTAYEPGEDYYEMLRKYVIEREDLVNVPEYREFIREASVSLARHRGEKVEGYYERLLCAVKYAGENFRDEKVKQPLITIFAVDYINAFGTENLEELNALCNRYITDPGLKAEYQSAYEKK